MKRKTKGEKAITLIALILTIIVLLILAVVTIRAVTGDGILGYAKDAKKEHNLAQAIEEVQLALNEWKIKKYADRNPNFKSFLEEKFESVVENGDGTYTVTIDGQEIKVSEDEVLGSIIETGEAIGTTGNTIRIGDLVYVISDEENKTATVYGYRGDEVDYSTGNVSSYDLQMTSEEISIASKVEIDGKVYTVNNTGTDSFYNANTLKKITIPNTVTNIGAYSFSSCINMSEIIIPNSVTNIGNGSFSGCINMPEIIIPNSVTNIGDWAFRGCTKLEKVILPDSIKDIGSFAFSKTAWLEKQRSNSPNKLVIVNNILVDGYTATGDIVIPDGVIYINQSAFREDQGMAQPGNKNITSVELPNSVISIGKNAFYDCEFLNEVILSQNLTTVEDFAFGACDNLSDIEIPEGLVNIGSGAFKMTQWLEDRSYDREDRLVIVNNILIDGYNASGDVEIPDGVVSIAGSCFTDGVIGGNRNLTSVRIPNSVTKIHETAFNYCFNVETIYYSGTATGAPWGAKTSFGGSDTPVLPNED